MRYYLGVFFYIASFLVTAHAGEDDPDAAPVPPSKPLSVRERARAFQGVDTPHWVKDIQRRTQGYGVPGDDVPDDGVLVVAPAGTVGECFLQNGGMPAQLLQHALSFLDSPDDFLAASLVCSYWRDNVAVIYSVFREDWSRDLKGTWRTVYAESLSISFLRRTMRLCRRVQHLTLSGISALTEDVGG